MIFVKELIQCNQDHLRFASLVKIVTDLPKEHANSCILINQVKAKAARAQVKEIYQIGQIPILVSEDQEDLDNHTTITQITIKEGILIKIQVVVGAHKAIIISHSISLQT